LLSVIFLALVRKASWTQSFRVSVPIAAWIAFKKYFEYKILNTIHHNKIVLSIPVF